MDGSEADWLPIGAVAELTGVTIPTLRAWETRYGFPAPDRRGRSHRRYRHEDVMAITRVVEARRAGYSLEAAIAQARTPAGADEQPTSIYAAVHAAWPSLTTRTISRTTMLGISQAIELECCARAARPLLIAAFQTADAYALARARWTELARTASATLVLAGFDRTTQRPSEPIEIAVAPRSPVLREWAVICDAPGSSACLVGWEHPDRRRRSRRPFEALWSVDPAVVRTAARAAVAIAAEHAPGQRMPDVAPVPARGVEAIDPDRLIALTDRIVTHLDAALEHR